MPLPKLNKRVHGDWETRACGSGNARHESAIDYATMTRENNQRQKHERVVLTTQV